ncbi:Phospholipid:diacylglycerol acyltransferase [Rhodotorula toruloides]|nr:Phospholipid:diacylglycerol acyltransferase [Rhodotorula toruloides]
MSTVRRRNQPKRNASAPANQLDTDDSSPAPSRPDSPDVDKAPVREVPLFKRRLKKGDGKVEDPKVILDEKTGRVSLDFPRTPYDQLDLSDSFLAALHEAPFEPKKTWTKRRRGWFFLGGLLGLCAGWMFTEGDPLASLANLDLDAFSSWDLQSILADMPSLSALNVTELLAPGREWLNSRVNNFDVGRDAAARGLKKKHAVILVPGIISSGLESWSTKPDAAPFFRSKVWAGTSMIRAVIKNKEAWVKAISLDPFTGLDQDGYKIRAAQGLDAASAFMPGYWIWQKVIENLAVLDYDHNDLSLASYDWRLAFYNLEVRDRYFSRLKASIEFNLAISGQKTVLVSHSMGSSVLLWFFKWVESPKYGNGGPDWVERHVSDWVNVAGTMLGVPKAMAALLSGEMRDTVTLSPAVIYLLERFFSRSERAKLFRSWAGAASMMLKGGNDVWGDEQQAPDDMDESTITGGKLYYFRPENYSNTSEVTEDAVHPNLTLNDATSFLLEKVPPSYQQMLASNFSFGFERDEEQLVKNNDDHSKWSNPLEVQLPKAPSMTIYCLYGVGKETERAYFYQQGGYEHDETPTVNLTDSGASSLEPVCLEPNCTDSTPRPPLDLPLQRRVWIDGSVTMDEKSVPKVRSGVVFNDGDGTVSLLSLGSMCIEGWKRPLYNPAGIKVVTHEILHAPLAFDPRGGPTTADHVDILGSSELNDAILDIAAGQGERVKDQYHSRIQDIARKIRWEG